MTWHVELEVATWLVQLGGGKDVVTWGRLLGAMHCFCTVQVTVWGYCLDTVHSKKKMQNF